MEYEHNGKEVAAEQRSEQMTGLAVEGLVKQYGAVTAVRDVSFSVAPGEFISLLGPSGCGKTTTLRCIAGFERPQSGRIIVNGTPVVDAARNIFTPPNKRNFGIVFQSYAIWPHKTVLQNVSYPLEVQGKYNSHDIVERAAAKLKSVGLTGFEARLPTQLSGGQQQRVALARALAMEPDVLLFDEPLSNLDAKLRERMRFELIELQNQLGIPAVYVTHDQSEAMVMSSRVIVMSRGEIAQIGGPEAIYATPRNRFVADFIGLSNFVEGRIKAPSGSRRWVVECNMGDMICESVDEQKVGQSVLVAIRPENVNLGGEGNSAANHFYGSIKNQYYLGSVREYFVEVGSLVLRAQQWRVAQTIGDKRIAVSIAPSDCRILPVEPTGQ